MLDVELGQSIQAGQKIGGINDLSDFKVQAMLRRAYDFAGTAHLLSCGGAVLNVSDGTLTANGQKVELTRNEFKILQLLLEHRGEIVSREAIMTRLWESDSFVDENTLTVNVAR